MVHGSMDQFVPVDHGRRILAAISTEDKRLLEIPIAAHADVFIKGGNDLYLELTKFFQKTLPRSIKLTRE